MRYKQFAKLVLPSAVGRAPTHKVVFFFWAAQWWIYQQHDSQIMTVWDGECLPSLSKSQKVCATI